MRMAPTAATGIVSALMLAPLPALAAGLQPLDLIRLVYANVDDREVLPGGPDIWGDAIVAAWQQMLARRQAAGLPDAMAFPLPGTGQSDTGEIETEVTLAAYSQTHVRVTYRDGDFAHTLTYGLVHHPYGWRIVRVWREDAGGVQHTLTQLLETMP